MAQSYSPVIAFPLPPAMVKLRTSDPFMPADDYGREIAAADHPALGINLLVRDVAVATAFQSEVLGCDIVYQDPDFAVVRYRGSEWMVHADHAYRDNPLTGIVAGAESRGAGIELRLYGCDPDAAERRALGRGDIVLAGSIDKPHGLREAILVDPDGYVWVPGIALDKKD